jgi:ATP-dependent DNA helicase 2 subunit 2
MLRDLVEVSGGSFITMSKAIADISVPTIKTVRPTATYKGSLTLGDVGKFPDTSLRLEVERYPKIMILKPPTAKQFVLKSEFASDGVGPSAQSSVTMKSDEPPASDSLTAVKRARSYQVDDADAPGGKRDVDADELERGYEYGRTAVNVSKDDLAAVNLETRQSLEIVGFVSAETVSFATL